MSTVTLLPDKRAAGCLVVEIDGGRYASLPLDIISRLGLQDGCELSDEQNARLTHEAAVESAYRAGMKALALRPRARRDLERRLVRRGHAREVVALAADRLDRGGLLDDARYAHHAVSVWVARGHGPGRLLRDLLSSGVDRRVAEEAIEHELVANEIDLGVEVQRLAVKRRDQLGDLPPATLKRRLVGYLARRGYSGSTVMEVVDRVVSAPMST